ncbi:hypothetical protein K0M31_009958 [Melipona bicolor]|uniref:cGMP-dependent protein kinase N-terminal coiled-coil domain-containing protein n=1 Tax=Melipona bicolor TaxID=60889 RepID=A0AA40FNP0_9HYME|nr:hypothetical protein K0M31_009958 [Melipona bicolor]
MDEGTKCRVPIGDACVSMRVCFDSLCFSSTQQRLADEEDASQLPTHGAVAVVAAAGQRAISNVTGATTITAMGTLRELQELLRVKDEKIAELEALLCRRDAEIQELRSHLDKFLSVLPFKSPLTPTKPRPRKQRAQGISAEPPLQELATLTVVDKSDRLVSRNRFFLSFFSFLFFFFTFSLKSWQPNFLLFDSERHSDKNIIRFDHLLHRIPCVKL